MILLILLHTTNDIIFINCLTRQLCCTHRPEISEKLIVLFFSFLFLSLRLNIVMCSLVYLKPFRFLFIPKKQNRGRQKTRTARSGRETPTLDSTGQSCNLRRLRLPEGNAEIRFCVEISFQRLIFFRASFSCKVSQTKPILKQGLMMLKIVFDFQHVSKSILFVQKITKQYLMASATSM